ncbi:MAG: SPOR domain-containing protein [Candidatus Binatia bacterium]
MVERRYGFRLSGIEGVLLLSGALGASFFIFVSGVYVGREVAGRKISPPIQTVRMPVVFPKDPPPQRRVQSEPQLWPTVREPSSSTNLIKPVESQEAKSSQHGGTATEAGASVGRREQADKPDKKILAKNDASLASERSKKNESPTIAPRNRTTDVKPREVEVVHANVTSEKKLSRQAQKNPDLSSAKKEKPKVVNPEFDTEARREKKERQWQVQIGATTYQETAQDMARELRVLGFTPFVSKVRLNGETLYRVRVGKFSNQVEAVTAVNRFRREGRFSQAYIVSD